MAPSNPSLIATNADVAAARRQPGRSVRQRNRIVPQERVWLVWLCMAVVCVLYGSAALADHAGSHAWTGEAGDGLFESAGNWNPVGIPLSPNDLTVFNLDETYTVELGQDRTNQRLFVRDGDVSLDIGEHTYTLDASAPALLVASSAGDEATLRLIGGELRSRGVRLAQDADSVATMFVSGPETTWEMFEPGAQFDRRFGDLGTATLHITDGALVDGGGPIAYGSGSEGTVLVSGEATRWIATDTALLVGRRGDGILHVTDGATVRAGTPGYRIAEEAGSTGEVLVSGNGSFFRNSSSQNRVGDAGTGTLTVEDGGLMHRVNSVGHSSTGIGTVTVRGQGSEIQTNSITVGNAGSGMLIIEDGGRVRRDGILVVNYNVHIGSQAGSQGEVIVRDAGSRIHETRFLRVGDVGSGILRIENGGTVTHRGSTYFSVGHSPGGSGDVIVTGEGSTFSMRQLYLGGSNSAAGGTGSLTIGPGASVEVSPTSTAGLFKIWEGEDNTLTYLLGGTSFGDDYGHLSARSIDLVGENGTAGTLRIELDDFQPALGDSFDLLSFNTLEGQFASLDLAVLPSDRWWDDTRLYTDGTLRVLPTNLSVDLDTPQDLLDSLPRLPGNLDMIGVSDRTSLIAAAWLRSRAASP